MPNGNGLYGRARGSVRTSPRVSTYFLQGLSPQNPPSLLQTSKHLYVFNPNGDLSWVIKNCHWGDIGDEREFSTQSIKIASRDNGLSFYVNIYLFKNNIGCVGDIERLVSLNLPRDIFKAHSPYRSHSISLYHEWFICVD